MSLTRWGILALAVLNLGYAIAWPDLPTMGLNLWVSGLAFGSLLGSWRKLP